VTAESVREGGLDYRKKCVITRLGVVPVVGSPTQFVVPFKINSVESVATLDTGGIASFITPGLAAAAKAGSSYGGAIGVEGIGGHAFVAQWVWVNTVAIGEVKWGHGVRIAVIGSLASDPKQTMAVVGMDLLDQLDYDLDFANHKVSVYSTENCLHPEPPWEDTSTGLALNRVERDHKVTIPVAFEGGVLDAEFDTGSDISYLTKAGARRAGVSDAELAKDPRSTLPGIDGVRNIRKHRFSEIAIGEDVLRDFQMAVDESPHSDLSVDMIIGMDYIAKHHLWLSLSTNALFIDSGEKKRTRAS
jgi:Aspartyl protease